MKRIIDICFDYNYKELVEHGYREKGILDFHVVDCPIHFEYGLLKPFTKEHMIENLKKYYSSQWPLTKDIIAGWKCDIDNYFESLENAKEIRFWISNTVNNIVGLEITCTMLKEQIPTYVCFLPRLDLTNLNIDIFSDLDRKVNYYLSMKKMLPVGLSAFKKNGKKLLNENKELRIIHDNQIHSVDGDYFDSEFYKVINSGCTSWEDFIEKSPDDLIQNQQWICNWIYIRYKVHELKKEWK